MTVLYDDDVQIGLLWPEFPLLISLFDRYSYWTSHLETLPALFHGTDFVVSYQNFTKTFFLDSENFYGSGLSIEHVMWNKNRFQNFLKLFILDNARKLHFIIIWMQEFNNFICQGMGKILSKTRSNWLSCLAWNFVMSHNLCVIVMSYFDSFYFCTNHTRYFIFDIQVWVIFMTHYFDCCIFCDFVIRWQLYDRCFLILLQLLS